MSELARPREPASGERLAGRGGVPLIVWGVLVLGIAAFGVLVFGLGTLPALLLAGGGSGSLVVGAAVQLAGARPRRPRAEPDLSFATVAATVGVTFALVGVAAGGAAFAWTGLGIFALAVGGLIRESMG